MNLKLKSGKSFLNDEGIKIEKAIGRLQNLTFAINSGIFSKPENLKLQIRCKIAFYAETEISGNLKPCYYINLSEDDADAINLLISPSKGDNVKEVIENAIYDYILTIKEYKTLFEIVK